MNESDEDGRQRLADQDLERREGCRQQFVEGALLMFARHRERRMSVYIMLSDEMSAGIMFQRDSRLGLNQHPSCQSWLDLAEVGFADIDTHPFRLGERLSEHG